MQQNYLLLRNNQQTGPYNLEQLLQLQLKPFDLVWVNGRSAAWQYPGEITALKPYVPQTPQPEVPFQPIATAAMERQAEPVRDSQLNNTGTPARNVFVSMPKNNSSHIRFPAESKPDVVPSTNNIPIHNPVSASTEDRIREESVPAKPVKSLYANEEPISTWNVKPAIKKKPSISAKDFSIVVLLAGVIAGGYYILSRPSIVQKPAIASHRETVVPDSHLETPVTIAKTESNSNIPDVVSTPVIENKKHGALPVVENKIIVKPEKKSSMPVPDKGDVQFKVPAPVSGVSNVPEEETTKAPATQSDERAPVEKKKKLREVIKNIFTGKKAKTEEPKNNTVVLEEPRPATNRKAARRADDPPASSNTTHEEAIPLAEMVDITSNAPDNWMMGVTGLKITLRNRSQVVIQTAAVDVLYYDANNRLLEKKMVFFNHVPAGGKLTMAAPDDKWADHVDLKLSAVSAKDSRYASN